MDTNKFKKIKTIASFGFLIIVIVLTIIVLIDMKDILIQSYQEKSVDLIRLYFEDLGILGIVILIMLHAVTILFTVIPLSPLQIVTGIIYNYKISFLICFIGAVLGNFFIYLLIRKIGSAFLSFFKKKDVEQVEFLSSKKMNKRFTIIILITYLIPGLPYGLIAYLTTKTSLKFWRYFIVTTLGVIPSIVIAILLSTAVVKTSLVNVLILMGLFIIIAFLAVKYTSRIFAFLTKDIKDETL